MKLIFIGLEMNKDNGKNLGIWAIRNQDSINRIRFRDLMRVGLLISRLKVKSNPTCKSVMT